jgi:FkbM family methyltransferase
MRRVLRAAQFGFAFRGTRRTRFPTTLVLNGKRRELSIPRERGYTWDLINVWLDDEYGLESLERSPKTVLDVGANVGLFSLWSIRNFPRAIVHAYEPNPRIWPYLQSNLEQTDISIYRTGIGRESGRAQMVDSSESRLASTSFNPGGEIVIESLETAIDRLGGTIDLLKLDCEGAEWDLLDESNSCLRKVGEIRLEYHLGQVHSFEEFKAKVDKTGFSIVKHKPNQGFGIAWLRGRKR